jgi:hypothetical protein
MFPTICSHLAVKGYVLNPATEALERSLRNGASLKRSRSANLSLGLLQVDAVEIDILSCELSKKMEFSGQDISKKKHQPRYSCPKRRCQGLVRTKKSAELKSLEVPDDDVKPGGSQHNNTKRLSLTTATTAESVTTLYKAQ